MTPPFDHQLAIHLPRVHRAALGFMGDREEARELAQESLLKAYRARDRYDATRPFYPWLYRIVKNTCLDALARRRHRAQPGLQSDRVPDPATRADDQIDAAQTRRRLHTALSTLSAEHQEVLNLRHFQDLSYAEIGETLNLPRGTVMSRLYRARQALTLALETP